MAERKTDKKDKQLSIKHYAKTKIEIEQNEPN